MPIIIENKEKTHKIVKVPEEPKPVTVQPIVALDAEFTGLVKNGDLISIAFVTEDCEFYAEFTDYDVRKADNWVQKNVIERLLYPPKLMAVRKEGNDGKYSMHTVGTKRNVAETLKAWFSQFEEKAIIVSDVLAYDWVHFADLFDGALNLGDKVNAYYIPMDISTMMWDRDVDPDINREEFSGLTEGEQKHSSLWDAKVILACYKKLKEM